MTDNKIIEISIKVIPLGEFADYSSWLEATTKFGNQLGLNSKLLNQDCNGLTTTGYNLKNKLQANVFPVKIYLLIQDDKISQTTSYKPITF